MIVLVTGSGGYIAEGVIAALVNRGHQVIALGQAPLAAQNDAVNEIIGNIFDLDFSTLSAKPDVLLHLAWRDGFNHKALSHLEDLPKHYEFIAKALDAGIDHVAIMGSMHEVGYWEGAIDEKTPCNPTTPYGVAKNALRQLSLGLCEQAGACFQWLRGFYLSSADGRGDSIFSKIVAAANAGDENFPFTSGLPQYDFLSYEEFCVQVASVVAQTEVSGIINICSGEPVALKDYVEGFIEENGFEICLEYGKYPDRPYDSPATWGDNTKIKRILENAG